MAAPAYVRNTSVQNAGNGGDVAFTISPSATVGDLLLVAYDSSAAQLNFPSDFAHLGTFSGTGTNDVWYKYLQAGDAGRTVDFGSSVSLFQFILIECSGAAGPPTLTTHAVTNGGASGNVAVSGPTTSAADPWLPIVLWASFDGTGSLNASITSLSGVTLIANLSPGAGYPNALAAGYQAGQAAGATNPASSAACDTGSTQTSVAALIAVHSATAPSAATLATPPNASYLDATVGATFQANFNSTSGANANAYALRIKSGGAYSYWNAGTSSWQSTIVWNACSVAPGAQLAVGPITAGLANGTTYNWSMAFQEATASLQGPFASDFTFSAQSAPTLVVNAPTGTVTTTNEPVVSWTTTPGGTAAQTSYRVVVYPSSVYTAGGFAAGQASGAVWDSGVVASASQSVVMGAPLPTNNTTYRAYVQVTETGGETSAWQFSGFTLSLDTPATPTITATAGTDPATGCPRIALAIQGHDNLLTADDASVEGSVGTHAARTNCSVAQSTAQAQDGTHSLALTSTAAGAMSESTATGTSGYPVTPGATYSWMSSYRAAATARNCRTDIAWYNAAGTLLSTSQGAQVTDTTTGWTPSVGSAVAPAGAAFATAVGNVLSTAAAGEIHYEDEWGIAPGSLGYELVVASDTPVGYWKLGNPAGTTEADSSGNGNNGTIHGTVTGGQAGPIATYPAALADLFDGSTGYISTSWNPTGFTVVTLEAWIRTTSASGFHTIVSKYLAWNLQIQNGYLNTSDYHLGLNYTSTNPVNDGNWHHVAVTIRLGVTNGSQLYVDGQAACPAFTVSAINSDANNVSIGGAAGDFFPGSIDEVAVYNTALSAARIAAHYNAATVAGSYVQGWSRGGLVGSTTVAILRSDGLYVRGATRTTPTSIPSAGQAAAVYDYEAALNKPYTYTAVVSAVVGGSTISSTPSADTAAVTTTSRAAWLVVPGTPASNIQLWISKFDATTRSVSQGVTAGIGNPTEFITSDVYRKRHGKLTLSTLDMATRDALQTVLLNGKVLLLQRPSPDPNPAIAGMQLYFLPVGDLTEDKFSSHANTRERTLSVAVVEQPVP